MNLPSENRLGRRAFTLVELLTVIAIIAILMGMLFVVVPIVMDRAYKAEAKTAASGIVTALKTYYTEYGKCPVADYATANPPVDIRLGGTGTPGVVDNNADLFNILRSINAGRNSDNQFNPKRISFLEGHPVKNPSAPKSGFLDNGGTGVPGAYYDPWGRQYIIIIDANYNGVINLAGVYSDFTQRSSDDVDTGVLMGIGVISLGKDGELGSPREGVIGMYRNGDRISDDVASWQ